MKLRVQAQHLQPGDIVGSGEKIKPHDLHIGYSRTSDFTVHMEGLMCKGCKPDPIVSRLQQEASNDAQYWWRNENDQTTAN